MVSPDHVHCEYPVLADGEYRACGKCLLYTLHWPVGMAAGSDIESDAHPGSTYRLVISRIAIAAQASPIDCKGRSRSPSTSLARSRVLAGYSEASVATRPRGPTRTAIK